MNTWANCLSVGASYPPPHLPLTPIHRTHLTRCKWWSYQACLRQASKDNEVTAKFTSVQGKVSLELIWINYEWEINLIQFPSSSEFLCLDLDATLWGFVIQGTWKTFPVHFGHDYSEEKIFMQNGCWHWSGTWPSGFFLPLISCERFHPPSFHLHLWDGESPCHRQPSLRAS